ncbi:MAG: hypothetical protein AAB702_00565 [Patescibacteria group bacterium]
MNELASRDPRGCSAVVETELLASEDNAVVSEVIFDCRRHCNVFERKELLGSRSQVDQDTSTFVRSAIENGCLKLEELRDNAGDMSPGFLPPIIEL